jgi:thiol-disulfide isomerase/thioredoxin
MPRLPVIAISLVLAAACGTPRAKGGKLELVDAPPGPDVAALVKEQLGRSASDGRKLLVYVGASWCEPCRRFHAAAEAGQLDGQFPDLRLLVFDLDRDSERLAAAGYVSQYIPLFALPDADGRASARHIEGSIKGDSAVGEIGPRLRSLLR